MGKPQGPIKAKPAWDKRAAIEKSRTKHLNQLSKLKKLRARLEAQGRAKPLEIKDNVEALERELLGSNSQAPQQQQQQQQQQQPQLGSHRQGGGLPSTSGRHEPSADNAIQQERQPHKKRKQAARPHEQLKSQHQTEEGHPVECSHHDGPHNHHHHQQQQQQQQQQQHGSNNQDQGGAFPHTGNARRRQRPPGKQMSKTQRLAMENEARKAEAQKAKQEAERARAEHQAKVEQSKKLRGKEKQKFFKKTKKGQPVMKYRMDKVLAALQKEQH